MISPEAIAEEELAGPVVRGPVVAAQFFSFSGLTAVSIEENWANRA